MAGISVKKKMQRVAATTEAARDAANPAAPVPANVVLLVEMQITWVTRLVASAGAAVKAKHQDKHKPRARAGRAMQWVDLARARQHLSRAEM